MKRFLLFMGNRYYPWGGWEDFAGSYDTAMDARKVAEEAVTSCKLVYPWAHVVDTETRTIVCNFDLDPTDLLVWDEEPYEPIQHRN